MSTTHVIVQPVASSGGRTVRVGSEILGVAYSMADLVEFLRRAGHPDPQALVRAGPDAIEWRGEGRDEWTRGTPRR